MANKTKRKKKLKTQVRLTVLGILALIAVSGLLLNAVSKREKTKDTDESKSSAALGETSRVGISSEETLSEEESSDGAVQTGAGTGYGYKGEDRFLRIPNLKMPLTDDEIPKDLVTVGFGSNGKEFKLDSVAAGNLKKMMQAAEDAGMNLYISSAYRTVQWQEETFEARTQEAMAAGLDRFSAENEVARQTARPRTSDHNLGLAVDFNGVLDSFKDTKEYAWLIGHCAEYGFILRYPADKTNITKVDYEPWHYRYVGKSHAEKIMKQKITLEEYVQTLK